MGRHSAPDDTDDADADAVAAADQAQLPAPRGRHHAPEPDELAPAPVAIDADQPAEQAAAQAAPQQPADRPERGSQADLRLLRERPAVRAQCLAAVLVPFVVYTIVLVVISSVHIYVLWLWAPIIIAGILVGSVLDAAHRRGR